MAKNAARHVCLWPHHGQDTY